MFELRFVFHLSVRFLESDFFKESEQSKLTFCPYCHNSNIHNRDSSQLKGFVNFTFMFR